MKNFIKALTVLWLVSHLHAADEGKAFDIEGRNSPELRLAKIQRLEPPSSLNTHANHDPFAHMGVPLSCIVNFFDYLGVRSLMEVSKHTRTMVLRHLETVTLSGRMITDKQLRYLSGFVALKNLDLDYCGGLTDEGLRFLSSLHKLESLSLALCNKLTDNGLQHLSDLVALKSLMLVFCTKLTDEGLVHLVGLDTLENLSLLNCNKLGDAGLRHLLGLQKLKNLSLSSNNLTDKGLQYLSNFIALKNLGLEEA